MSNRFEGKVALLYGGVGSEREISLRTGAAFERSLERIGCEFKAFDFDANTVAGLLAYQPDVALIAMHGGLGEGGPLQGLLECIGVPYTSSGVLASSLAMDKGRTKDVLRSRGVPTPDWTLLYDRSAALPAELSFPLVVKPPLEGSSVGVELVDDEPGLRRGLDEVFKLSDCALVEARVVGRELSVGVMDGELLGIVEIRPAEGRYDYEAKYQRADTSYLVPAPLQGATEQAVARCALAAWEAVGCRGVGRVDVMLDHEERPWVLELNTVPGMTESSLVPKMAAARGWSFDELVVRMLRAAHVEGGIR